MDLLQIEDKSARQLISSLGKNYEGNTEEENNGYVVFK